jgi:hypothetical protein
VLRGGRELGVEVAMRDPTAATAIKVADAARST